MVKFFNRFNHHFGHVKKGRECNAKHTDVDGRKCDL